MSRGQMGHFSFLRILRVEILACQLPLFDKYMLIQKVVTDLVLRDPLKNIII